MKVLIVVSAGSAFVSVLIETLFTSVNTSSIFRPKNSFMPKSNKPAINKATIMLLIVAFTDCTNLFFMYSSLCYNSDSKGYCCYYRSS